MQAMRYELYEGDRPETYRFLCESDQYEEIAEKLVEWKGTGGEQV